jgi:hypothetical protein
MVASLWSAGPGSAGLPSVSLPSVSLTEPQPGGLLSHAARSPGTNACRNLPLTAVLGE